MKLYKTTFKSGVITTDGREITKAKWDTSAASASKTRTSLKAKNAGSAPTTEEVDVTTVRASLVEFLNKLTG